MPHHRKVPLWPVAVAPARASEIIGVHRKVIARATADGSLRVYEHGKARRILVCDLVDWVKSTWRLVGSRYAPPAE